MDNFLPAGPLSTLHNGPRNVGNCTIVDASSLLYRPALRAAVVREQVALLATRLAIARWSSARSLPQACRADDTPPYRAAFYARAQEDFFAWIERGGVWESHDAAAQQNDGAGAVVRTAGPLQRSTPSEE